MYLTKYTYKSIQMSTYGSANRIPMSRPEPLDLKRLTLAGFGANTPACQPPSEMSCSPLVQIQELTEILLDGQSRNSLSGLMLEPNAGQACPRTGYPRFWPAPRKSDRQTPQRGACNSRLRQARASTTSYLEDGNRSPSSPTCWQRSATPRCTPTKPQVCKSSSSRSCLRR